MANEYLENIITEERAAKGDMVIERDEGGNIKFAQAQFNNIMNYLYNRRILDNQHIHDGQIYELWKMIFNARLGYGYNKVYSSDIAEARSAVIADNLPSSDFTSLIRALGARNCRIIEIGIYQHATPFSIALLKGRRHWFRPAFDALSNQMEFLRRKNEESACNEENFK